MTRIAAYNASWSTFGGGEKYLCALAEDLASGHDVDVSLVSDQASATIDDMRRYFGLRLDNIRLLPTARRDVRRTLRGADAAVIMSNVVPFGLPARNTVYILQIPYPPLTANRIRTSLLKGQFREGAKDLSRRFLLRDARRARGVIVYSQFVADTLARHHAIAARILHPPIDDFFLPGIRKEPAILSVGRIFRGPYNDKRYDILVEMFRRLCALHPSLRCEYWIAGACADDETSQRYLEELRRQAEGLPVRFMVNHPYDRLREAYNRASVFWHAAGYGVDEEREPERTEHFGMSTVEAMSARCVPIVVNRGGQKGIVSHGESGYLWNTAGELIENTARVLNDPAGVDPLRDNARRRFAVFTRERFRASALTIFQDLKILP